MIEIKYKVGDVVVLKSGGPLMTVTGHLNSNWVNTIWFDEVPRVNQSAFPEDCLVTKEEAMK